MNTKSKFVSIENDNGEINLCFWADNAKSDLETFKFCKSQEEAEYRLKYWTSERKDLGKA